MLSQEEVIKIAKLARLELSVDEIEEYRRKLGRVLDYFRELEKLDTSGAQSIGQMHHDAVGLREDKTVVFEGIDLLLSNAVVDEDAHFLIPPLMEHE